MALAVNSSPKDRADAVNRLWGLTRQLSSSQRERFGRIARSATHDPDAGVRGQALFALGELKEPSDIAGLEAALADPDWFVRLAAAYALSWQQPPAAVTSVARLLDDPESMVREQVTGILRAMAQSATDPSARHEAIAVLDAAGLPRK
jgi:HEAT repeat protein